MYVHFRPHAQERFDATCGRGTSTVCCLMRSAFLVGQQGPNSDLVRRAASPTVPERAQWAPATAVEAAWLHKKVAEARETCLKRGGQSSLSLSLDTV